MALLRLTLLFVVLASAARGVEISFVPAAAEGTVSLGIFDDSGRLVRLLCDGWSIGDFHAGLDSLSTEWDGKDSAGKPVPAGSYRARGFVTGHIGVEGEAFHFNDWIASDNAPRILSVAAACPLPGGDLLLSARLAGGNGALLRFTPGGANPWRTIAPEPAAAPNRNHRLAVAGERVFLLADNRVRGVDLTSGKDIPIPDLGSSLVDLSARDGRLAILGSDAIKVFGASDFAKRREIFPPPVRPVAFCLLGGDAVVAAGEDGSLWYGNQDWRSLEVPSGSKVRAVAAGRGDTFWTIEQNGDGSIVIAQYSPEEGRLAEWVSADGGEPVSLAASTESDYFSAIFALPAAQRTVAIRRRAGGGWEFVVDKTITGNSSFGWLGGELSPVSGNLPGEITVDLLANPLDPSAPRSLVLRATATDDGTELASADGLPLVRISGEAGFKRVMVLPGPAPGTASFYQGDGACVEQYSLRNLGAITSFDAGTIRMTDSGEAPPPPFIEPEDDPSAAQPGAPD